MLTDNASKEEKTNYFITKRVSVCYCQCVSVCAGVRIYVNACVREA